MFREIGPKSAFSSDLERGTEFDVDDDTGPELAAADDVRFLLQLDIGMREDSWASLFPFGLSPRTTDLAEPRTRDTSRSRDIVSLSLGIM